MLELFLALYEVLKAAHKDSLSGKAIWSADSRWRTFMDPPQLGQVQVELLVVGVDGSGMEFSEGCWTGDRNPRQISSKGLRCALAMRPK